MRFCSLDEAFKSSSYIPEAILDPEFGHAYESNKAAFNKAFNTDEDMWIWAERPENKFRLVRFAAAKNGMGNFAPTETILEGSGHAARVFSHYRLIFETSNLQGTPGDSSLRAR